MIARDVSSGCVNRCSYRDRARMLSRFVFVVVLLLGVEAFFSGGGVSIRVADVEGGKKVSVCRW